MTGFGSASITVTGTCCPASLKIWVMPSFFPTIPIISRSFLVSRCGAGGLVAVGLWDRPLEASVAGRLAPVDWSPSQSTNPYRCAALALLHFDFDVHARRQVQLRQRVHRL